MDSFGARANIDPSKLPWDAFQTILIQNLYGGKVDNVYDAKILESLVESIFSEKSYDPKHVLFQSTTVPDAIKFN